MRGGGGGAKVESFHLLEDLLDRKLRSNIVERVFHEKRAAEKIARSLNLLRKLYIQRVQEGCYYMLTILKANQRH